MHDYEVLFEQGQDGGWGAYCPDLPGLGVVGETRDEVQQLITEGIEIHLAGIVEDRVAGGGAITRLSLDGVEVPLARQSAPRQGSENADS